jgi:general secretion pathway protein F
VPMFRYKALSSAGEPLNGQMEAATANEVVLRLQEAGHLPIEARPASEAEAGAGLAQLFQRRDFTDKQTLQFTQQLATLLNAGQPLDRSLGILLDLPETPQARRLISRVRDGVRGGATLSATLEQQHGVFSRLYVNMVRAGEVGGNLNDTLTRLADYLERSQNLRSRVVNALIYPVILVTMISLAMLFLLGYVVPQFETMYEGLGVELPWLTALIIGVGGLVRDFWWLMLGGVALLVLWLGRRFRDPVARAGLDAWLLRRRLVGPMVARLETARLARTLGTLLKNGVPLLQSLSIARNVVGNRVLASAVEAASEDVKTGGGLAHALQKHPGFPRLALQMIQVGEESGELDTMLLKVADTFDTETGHAIDRMLTALVPVLTVLMSVVIGIVILAILTPIYDLTSAIG